MLDIYYISYIYCMCLICFSYEPCACLCCSMAERFVDQMRTVLESEARIALLKEKDELQQHIDWERDALKEERAKLEEAWRALDEKIEKFKYEKETFVNEKRKVNNQYHWIFRVLSNHRLITFS